ncbi:Gamma-glutamyl peptidase 1 [Porphyridium purpureum]|uniref:Gamma-glutamyl peptidase 1 n=1 Tax=Porphyridium purpureum TaxID=35688 RepID=A0A5J4YIH7_PORPP|nr:Gamma-glutamyl peptidase 1 [Porphyridium purpureum]|eukprot:POR9625..scf261_15
MSEVADAAAPGCPRKAHGLNCDASRRRKRRQNEVCYFLRNWQHDDRMRYSLVVQYFLVKAGASACSVARRRSWSFVAVPLEPRTRHETTMRIVVLDCQPLHQYRPELPRDSFGPCFDLLFSPYVDAGELELEHVDATSNRPLEPLLSRNDVHAFLVTGSFASAYDQDDWILRLSAFLRRVRDAPTKRVPILGVCFGFQIVAHAFGGEVISNPAGLEIGTVGFEPDMKGCTQLFGEDSALSRVPNPIILPYFHRDTVQRLPLGAISLGSNAHTPCQAFWIPSVALCVQGHPEFAADNDMYTALYAFTLRSTRAHEPRGGFNPMLPPEQHHHDWIAKLMFDFVRQTSTLTPALSDGGTSCKNI